jgi:hypothetical protein
MDSSYGNVPDMLRNISLTAGTSEDTVMNATTSVKPEFAARFNSLQSLPSWPLLPEHNDLLPMTPATLEKNFSATSQDNDSNKSAASASADSVSRSAEATQSAPTTYRQMPLPIQQQQQQQQPNNYTAQSTLLMDIAPNSDTMNGGTKVLLVVTNSENLTRDAIVAVFGKAASPVQQLTHDTFHTLVPPQAANMQDTTVNVFITDGKTITNPVPFTYTSATTDRNAASSQQQQSIGTTWQESSGVIVQDKKLLLAMLDRLDLLLGSAVSLNAAGSSDLSSDNNNITADDNRKNAAGQGSSMEEDSTGTGTSTSASTHQPERGSIMQHVITPPAQSVLSGKPEAARLRSNSPTAGLLHAARFTFDRNPSIEQRINATAFTIADIKHCVNTMSLTSSSSSADVNAFENSEFISDDMVESLLLVLLQRAQRQRVLSKELLSSTDINGRQLMHFAAGLGFKKMVSWLVKHGCNVNATDQQSRTPLHYAAISGDADMVTELLSAGADDTLKDVSGDTPMELTSRLRSQQRGRRHTSVWSVFLDTHAAEQPTQQDLNASITDDEADELLSASTPQPERRHAHTSKRSMSATQSPRSAQMGRRILPANPRNAADSIVDGYLSEGSFDVSDDYLLPSMGRAFGAITLSDMGVETDELEREVAGSDESFHRCVRHVQRKIRSYLYRRHATAKKIQTVARGFTVRRRVSKADDTSSSKYSFEFENSNLHKRRENMSMSSNDPADHKSSSNTSHQLSVPGNDLSSSASGNTFTSASSSSSTSSSQQPPFSFHSS